MIRPLRQTLVLWLLSLRDLLVSAGPVLLLALGVLVAAYAWLDPQPPRQVTLATGPAGSAYAEFGTRYAQALARQGIRVRLLATEGAQANLQALRDGVADLAFVRGGSADPQADSEAGIASLGALFYEPVWVFHRTDATAGRAPAATPSVAKEAPGMTRLTQLRGLRVNIDQPGSGVPELVQRLLAANAIGGDDIVASQLPPEAATEALLGGSLDALVLVSAPESPVVGRLLRAPRIALMDVARADAYARRFAFVQSVTLPRGVADLAADLPPHDVALLATTTSLLTREQTHPALRQLFAQAAQGLHGDTGWFNRARDFPNTRTSELPVSAEGDRAINGTPPFWQRYLPFWASNLLERMWLVIGGLIVLLLPLSRVVPPLYTYRVRQRVFRWYARLRRIEARLAEAPAERELLLNELDELDRLANQTTVPLAHTDELYALRGHIEAVRRRALARPYNDA
ncbi:MAG: ABC transporter substrate-binding protein [Rubrivivax sp.]|nr:ABC transporter substrate-binding protein [Rubrivivax sp.]HNT85616.1 TAXI family TRAP transporter solute-binding subunit [Ottowia sp.]HOZ94084.1 TAXI family TRAP transporter solute-binding subunit [Ottowia sp.]HQO52358.1 TAXI family TRAP transporter solute-binding subunit [Ottowia sp.]HQQ53156.1 TAXI family TRAP transporter solute-binding subunit [Ottowia sp.]